ncbi:MAG: 2-keto-3-deoxygluconate permease [Planctomycetota bacterium]
MAINRIPGGLMVVSLMLGAMLNTLTTVALCLLAVIMWFRYQKSQGIDSTLDDAANDGPTGVE